MSCLDTFQAYAFRSLGYGERLLPREGITLCDQFVLIGSGMIWNLYFAVLAVALGFWFATALAVGKASDRKLFSIPSRTFIYVFRGSPLFVQFFFGYEIFTQVPRLTGELNLGFMVLTVETGWLTRAWLGALIVLFLNTSAYTAEIFYGALRAVPKGDLEAADSVGMSESQKFWRVTWPTMLRLAWPSYTNEAIFLYHATALVFFSGFPAWRQQADALYYANYFAEQTFNPFVSYPIVALFFIAGTVLIIQVYGMANKRLNRHMAPEQIKKLKIRPQLIR